MEKNKIFTVVFRQNTQRLLSSKLVNSEVECDVKSSATDLHDRRLQ